MAKKNKAGKETPAAEESRPEAEKAPKKLSERELIAIVDNEIATSLGRADSKLSSERLQAMKYYLGDKVGNLAKPEAEGRSSVVSMDVADTVEWILPSLIKIFTAGDDAVEFAPRKEQDTEGAAQATDSANYTFYSQNEGFIILHDWFKDALLQKLGIIKTWWDDSQDITTEEYEGLSLEELTLMMQDGSVEVIQQTPRIDGAMDQSALQPPQAVYDVKVKRTAKTAHICIENVPPEEFLFSRKARTPQRIFACHHRLMRTVTELKEAGIYKNVDSLMADDSAAEFSQESVERNSDTDEAYMALGETADETMRIVWITESYLQVDWDGDGLAEWRKIVKSGKVLMANDEIIEHPFSMLTPIKMPHKLVGRSMADLLMDLQDIKTAIMRQFIDNMYLQNNPRQYVDETKGVNIDDLLDSRVGGIVRGKGENGVTPLITAPLSPFTFNLLEYLDQVKEGRTGVNSTFQGLDADTLNKTATGVNKLVSAAESRIEMIARIFAETGVKDLFRKILRLNSQYQKKEQIVRLRGKFVTVDPRVWKTQYDVVSNVGLGTGNKDQTAAHVMGVMSIQEKALTGGLPIVSPKQVYNAATTFAKSSGFKNADEFFIDPESDIGKQLAEDAKNRPNPEMAKVQGQLELQKQKSQGDIQVQQAQFEADQRMAETKAQADALRQEREHELEGSRMAAEAELKQREQEGRFQLEQLKAQNAQELAMYQAKLDGEAKIIAAQISAQMPVPDSTLAAADAGYETQIG